MLIRGDCFISGSATFNRYSIYQANSGYSATNIIDFAAGGGTKFINCLNVLGDRVTVSGVNYSPNKECKVFLLTTGSVNQFVYPSGATDAWRWITSRPSGISSGKALVITLVSTGFNSNGVFASFGMET